MSIQGFSSLSSNATPTSQIGADGSDVGRGGRERRQLTEVARMGGLAFDRALDAKRRQIRNGQAAPPRDDARDIQPSAAAGYGAQTAQIDVRTTSRPMPAEVYSSETESARRRPPTPPPGLDADSRVGDGGGDEVRNDGQVEATSDADTASDVSAESTESVETSADGSDGSIDISGFEDVEGDDDFVIDVESESSVDGIGLESGEPNAEMFEEVSIEEIDVSAAGEVIVAEQDIVAESDEMGDSEEAADTTRAGTVQGSEATASGATGARSSSPIDRGWTMSKPHVSAAAAMAAADVDSELTEAGTIGSGKARVVIGEGKERVVLNVSLTGDNVRVLARAATSEQAEALARNADSLAAALEERGLNLSNLAAHSDSSSSDHEAAAGGTFASPAPPEGAAAEEQTNPDLSLRGVRVVA